MKLIAKKPCSFGGKKFYIGDVIPGELILNPRKMEKADIITIVNDGAAPAAILPDEPSDTTAVVILPDEPGDTTAVVPLVIPGKDGVVSLELTAEDIQTVMDVLTDTAENAEKRIEQIDSDDILFLLNAADYRKTVKNAAKARAKALCEAQEGKESEGDQ